MRLSTHGQAYAMLLTIRNDNSSSFERHNKDLPPAIGHTHES